MPPFFQLIMTEYYILGQPDIELEKKHDIHGKTIHRIRIKAMKALVAALSEGDFQPLEDLKKFKRKPRRKERIQTRVWFAPN